MNSCLCSCPQKSSDNIKASNNLREVSEGYANLLVLQEEKHRAAFKEMEEKFNKKIKEEIHNSFNGGIIIGGITAFSILFLTGFFNG